MNKFFVIVVLVLLAVVGCGSSSKPTANSSPSLTTAKSVQRHSRFASSAPNPVPGDTLNASRGTWTNTPTSYTYQWQSCDEQGASCTPISGANSTSYTIVPGDVNHTLRTVVNACNPQGCSSKTSDQTALVINLSITTFCNIPAAYNDPTTGPHLCGWPDSTNTGYQNAPGYPGSLTTASSGSSTCPTVPQSNHTYNFCKYVGGLGLPGGLVNVTFFGSDFYSTNPQNANVQATGPGVNNITFSYDTFQPEQVSPPVSCAQSYQYGIGNESKYMEGYTVTHSDFWGFGNAIDTNGSTQTNPQIFTYNWVHDTVADANTTDTCGYHTDGIGAENPGAADMSYAITDHNTIQFEGNTNAIAWQNGNYSHMQNTNNLLSGDNETYAVARCMTSCTPPDHITSTGNTFNTYLPIAFVPIDGTGSPWTTTGSSWNHNFWAVPPGANWGTPAFNGYFWVPTGDSNYPEDCGFVSATDYPDVTNPPPCR